MWFKHLKKFTLLTTFLILSACVDKTRWENLELPELQWLLDETSCKHAAILEVNKGASLGRGFTSREYGLRNDQYRYQMARYEGLRKQDALINTCLQRKGYQKIKVSGSKNNAKN
jgi:hypothetical protein